MITWNQRMPWANGSQTARQWYRGSRSPLIWLGTSSELKVAKYSIHNCADLFCIRKYSMRMRNLQHGGITCLLNVRELCPINLTVTHRKSHSRHLWRMRDSPDHGEFARVRGRHVLNHLGIICDTSEQGPQQLGNVIYKYKYAQHTVSSLVCSAGAFTKSLNMADISPLL